MLTAVPAAVWILVSVCQLPGCMLILLLPGNRRLQGIGTVQMLKMQCLPAVQRLRL